MERDLENQTVMDTALMFKCLVSLMEVMVVYGLGYKQTNKRHKLKKKKRTHFIVIGVISMNLS